MAGSVIQQEDKKPRLHVSRGFSCFQPVLYDPGPVVAVNLAPRGEGSCRNRGRRASADGSVIRAGWFIRNAGLVWLGQGRLRRPEAPFARGSAFPFPTPWITESTPSAMIAGISRARISDMAGLPGSVLITVMFFQMLYGLLPGKHMQERMGGVGSS